MTLDDAIIYYDGIAKEYRANTDIARNDYMDLRDGAFEAEQLASWLNELKLLRERIEKHPKPCDDCISRSSVKQKLQEHHDFFVDAYGGFSNLPQNDKARVDEITICIAMVVNEPPVNPRRTGYWIEDTNGTYTDNHDTWECSECGHAQILLEGTPKDNDYNYCPNCGAKMEDKNE